MKKRLIDIYPSHSARAALPEEEAGVRVDEKSGLAVAKQRDFKILGKLLPFLILVFVLPPLAIHLFFSRATIQVWPQITKLHIQEEIHAQIGVDAPDLESDVIRARVFEEEKELTQLFSSSGTKFKEEKARGSITVYNENSKEPQALVANTRFISEDGKLFRSEQTVSVPGGRGDGRKLTPGFIDVPVIAAESGEEYNIESSSFSLPGLVGSASYTKIYGKSAETMAGGAAKEVSVVTEEDIISAKDELSETLEVEAAKALLARVPPQFQIIPESLVSTVLEDASLVKPGAELSEFTYTLKIRVAMTGFHREDADMLVRHSIATQGGEHKAVNEETLRISYTPAKDAGALSSIPIGVEIEADQYENIDERAFSRRVTGVSRTQFQELAAEYPFLAKAQFSLWPFWTSRIPKDSSRINFEVLLEG